MCFLDWSVNSKSVKANQAWQLSSKKPSIKDGFFLDWCSQVMRCTLLLWLAFEFSEVCNAII